jgi:hypothetical protein
MSSKNTKPSPQSRHTQREAAFMYWSRRAPQMLNQKVRPPREDLEYVAQQLEKMKDERFKGIIANMLAWDDDDRAELETLVYGCLQLLKSSPPAAIRDAFRILEMRYLTQSSQGEKAGRFLPEVLGEIQALIDNNKPL